MSRSQVLIGDVLQEKNVSKDLLDGKVGRMYVPQQEISSIATKKMKVKAFLWHLLLRSCSNATRAHIACAQHCSIA